MTKINLNVEVDSDQLDEATKAATEALVVENTNLKLAISSLEKDNTHLKKSLDLSKKQFREMFSQRDSYKMAFDDVGGKEISRLALRLLCALTFKLPVIELHAILEAYGFRMVDANGVQWQFKNGWRVDRDEALNYLVNQVKEQAGIAYSYHHLASRPCQWNY